MFGTVRDVRGSLASWSRIQLSEEGTERWMQESAREMTAHAGMWRSRITETRCRGPCRWRWRESRPHAAVCASRGRSSASFQTHTKAHTNDNRFHTHWCTAWRPVLHVSVHVGAKTSILRPLLQMRQTIQLKNQCARPRYPRNAIAILARARTPCLPPAARKRGRYRSTAGAAAGERALRSIVVCWTECDSRAA